MRFIMYGAGAVGGTLGARLFAAGHDVVLIARGRHGAVLAEAGLRFAAPDVTHTLRIPVVAEPAALTFRADDVVFLTMKSQDTAAALDALAAVAPPDLPVVCAQNGVDNERVALRRFANVHAMCVRCSASFLEPGVVRAFGAPASGIFDVGRFPGGLDDVDRHIAAILPAAHLAGVADPDVMKRKYAKLLVNASNALEAAAGPAARGSALRDRTRDEAVACFRAAGIAYDLPAGENARNGQIVAHAVDGITYEGNSTWQSLARGAAGIEADALNGEIVLLGRLYGIPVPVNAALQQIAHRLVRERIPAGSIPLDRLEREVDRWSERLRA
jgi:2-dehydropantoate 2-reductase